MKIENAIKLRDKLAVAASASQDWADSFRTDKVQFKKLLAAEAQMDRKIVAYFKELARERVAGWVDWTKYAQELPTQAAKPNFKVIVDLSQDVIDKEVGITTKVVFEAVATAVTAGAVAQITDSRIPVADLGTLVNKVASERAGSLATALTQTTIEKVRGSVETSLKLGEDIDKATSRLSKFIDDPARAEMIAKSESGSAWRNGVIEVGKQTGAVSKTWHTEGNPCQICEPMDGQTVAMDEDFEGGDGQMYSAEDGVHPNEQCGVSVNYKPEESD